MEFARARSESSKTSTKMNGHDGNFMFFSIAARTHERVQGDVNPIHLMLARATMIDLLHARIFEQRFHTIIQTFVRHIVFFGRQKISSSLPGTWKITHKRSRDSIFALIDLLASALRCWACSIDILYRHISKQHVNELTAV